MSACAKPSGRPRRIVTRPTGASCSRRNSAKLWPASIAVLARRLWLPQDTHRRANPDLSAFAKQRLMMKSFRLLPASEGPRREFKITLGLRAGDGPAGRTYDLEEAVRTAHRWMTERAARAEPFLSGVFTRGAVVSA